MTWSVYQHWDPLNVCVVGRSYPPEFYSFIQNSRLRSLFERIAIETEEDFQLLIKTLKSFNVKIIRPDVPKVEADHLITANKRLPGPISMNPRDQMIMIGEKFFVFPYNNISIKSSGRNIELSNWTQKNYSLLKGPSWPQDFTPYNQLPLWIQDECKNLLNFDIKFGDTGDTIEDIVAVTQSYNWWDPVTKAVKESGNSIVENQHHDALNIIPSNGITRIGRDLYFGISADMKEATKIQNLIQTFFQDYRCHLVTTDGHIDGTFTPVQPGLIVSIRDISTYQDTFPGWEVVYLEGESWSKVKPFLDLKAKNQGRWWIKGQEYDNELIDYVETWLSDWVGYVEESVFDVNILVIDKKNIIVNGYNKKAFEAFNRYGITAHICPMRHRYFWDGGVHCVTLDLDRTGAIEDYFPERNQ